MAKSKKLFVWFFGILAGAGLTMGSLGALPSSAVEAAGAEPRVLSKEEVSALTERATDVHEYEMSGINWVDASSGTLNVYNPMWIGCNAEGKMNPAVGQTVGDTNRTLLTSATTDVTGVFKFNMSVYDNYLESDPSGHQDFMIIFGNYMINHMSTKQWRLKRYEGGDENGKGTETVLGTFSSEPVLKKTDKSVTDWSKMEKNTIVFGVEWDEASSTTKISIAINEHGWEYTDTVKPHNAVMYPAFEGTASMYMYNYDDAGADMIYVQSTYDTETYVPDYVKDEAFTGVKDISEIVPMGANGWKVATEGAKNNKDKVVFLREDIEDYNAKMKVTVDDPAKFKMYVTMLQGETKDADLHANNGGVWMYLDNTVANMIGGGIGVTAKKLDAAGVTLEANKAFEVEYGMVRCNENGMFSGYEAYLKVNGTVLVKAYYAIGTLKDRGTYSGIFLNDQADSPCNVTIQAVELSKESPVKVELTPVRKISKKDEYTRFNVKVSGVFGNQKVSGLEIVEGNGSAVIEKNVDDQGNVKFEYLKILKEDGSTVKVKVTVTNEFGSFDSNIVEFKLAGASTGGEEAKGGCSGVIGTSVASLGLALTVAAGVFLKKKK